jgi:hypothetical protein
MNVIIDEIMNKIVFIIFTVLVSYWWVNTVNDTELTDDHIYTNSIKVELIYPDEATLTLAYKSFKKEDLDELINLEFIRIFRLVGDLCVNTYKGPTDEFKVKVNFVLNEDTFIELMKRSLNKKEVSFNNISEFERYLSSKFLNVPIVIHNDGLIEFYTVDFYRNFDGK